MSNALRDSAFMARPASISDLEARAHVLDIPTVSGPVRWRSFGSGSPLLLLHGGHGSWLHWVRNIEPLSARFRVLVPDMPGFGDSCDLDESGSLDAPLQRLTLALKCGLDQLVSKSAAVDVAGFSFGGLVAAHLQRVRGFRRLVLLGPAGHGSPWRREVQMPPWRDSGPDTRQSKLAENLSYFMIHEARCIDAAALYAQEISSLRARYHVRNVSRASRLGELLRECAAPIHFAWGQHDATGFAEKVGPELVEGVPARKWSEIPRAAHWVQFERADLVNALISDWCAESLP